MDTSPVHPNRSCLNCEEAIQSEGGSPLHCSAGWKLIAIHEACEMHQTPTEAQADLFRPYEYPVQGFWIDQRPHYPNA